ncbi:MAG: hypothetical protein HY675_02245 [Chloroflexi bacterium]|nr:hypothetical protein [Chloroflexota bacterium]
MSRGCTGGSELTTTGTAIWLKPRHPAGGSWTEEALLSTNAIIAPTY